MTISLPDPTPSSLSNLLADVEVRAFEGEPDVRIDALTHDSRRAGPGVLFTAYVGVNRDVHDFLPDAFARGASAALVERAPAELRAAYDLPADAPLVQVPDVRRARGPVAAALFGHPARDLRLVGVTGTDGKTTTSTLLHALLEAGGLRAGLVTTVAARFGDEALDTGLHVTTPEPEDLQRYLAAMRDAGAEVAVLETTSHGLAQHRLGGLAFDVAVFTNITHEAIEYHGSFEAYRDAKAMLLRALKPEGGTAVLNLDDPSFDVLAAIPAAQRLTYSRRPDAGADFGARAEDHGPAGLRFTAASPAGDVAIVSPLFGAYNVSNVLAALAAAHALGVPAEAWPAGVAAVRGIPGRMERIDEGQAFTAVVDFAHTPNALDSSLAAARPLAGPDGRVIAVFGCAGLRDPSKRAPMGRAAGRRTDITIVTAEDPRTESLAEVLEQVARGLREVGAVEVTVEAEVDAALAHPGATPSVFLREPDRGAAIARACRIARAGDIVLVLGKGHEQSMCFGTTEHPWDDRVVLRAVLRGEPRPLRLPTDAQGGRDPDPGTP